MLYRFPGMRRYMWQEWLKAFMYPELLAKADPLNMWAKLECIRRATEQSKAEQLVFGNAVDSFVPKQQFSPITLEGQRREHNEDK